MVQSKATGRGTQGGRGEGGEHYGSDCRCPLDRMDGPAARPPRVPAARRRGHRRQRIPVHHIPASGVPHRDEDIPVVRDPQIHQVGVPPLVPSGGCASAYPIPAVRSRASTPSREASSPLIAALALFARRRLPPRLALSLTRCRLRKFVFGYRPHPVVCLANG